MDARGRTVLTGDDEGARCIVNTGWAEGRHGYIVGAWGDSGDYFTVQLDDGSRFASLPGQVDPEEADDASCSEGQER